MVRQGYAPKSCAISGWLTTLSTIPKSPTLHEVRWRREIFLISGMFVQQKLEFGELETSHQ